MSLRISLSLFLAAAFCVASLLLPVHAQAPKRLVTETPVVSKRALVIGVTDYTLAPQFHVCGNDSRASSRAGAK